MGAPSRGRRPAVALAPSGGSARGRRAARPWLLAARPWLLATLVAVAVLALAGSGHDPTGLPFGYALRAAIAVIVVAGALLWWWTLRRGRGWGTDLVPALLGGIAGGSLAGALAGTPYAPGGLDGDQAFRTAAITRFGDDWHSADFTFQGLPSFYAPGYFWVLGRAADLTGLEAWRMAKWGTILAAVLVPLVTYLLWRSLVTPVVAALLAAVPLLVENFYEPYAWLVLFAIVPWWLATVTGLPRPDRPQPNPIGLGVIGALLFLSYYYFFFLAGLALLLYLLLAGVRRELRWRQLGRTGLVLGIAGAGAAIYWLPLLLSLLRAEDRESLANRWLAESHPELPLPMLEPAVTGVLSLIGLAYLVWTAAGQPLSRGLLVLLAAGYGWYLVGAPAVLAGTPLLSFRGKPLILVVLLTAGVLGLAALARRGADWLAAREPRRPGDLRRLVWALGTVLLLHAGVGFAGAVVDSPLVAAAHATALPDGSLPREHPPDATVPDPPAAQLRALLAARSVVPGEAVLLSDRVDLYGFYPYHGFLQWNAHYAHPAAGFSARVRLLEQLAATTDPQRFAQLVRHNRFEPIDAFVLRQRGDALTFSYSADGFPAGVRPAELVFSREQFANAGFELVPAGDHAVAVTR